MNKCFIKVLLKVFNGGKRTWWVLMSSIVGNMSVLITLKLYCSSMLKFVLFSNSFSFFSSLANLLSFSILSSLIHFSQSSDPSVRLRKIVRRETRILRHFHTNLLWVQRFFFLHIELLCWSQSIVIGGFAEWVLATLHITHIRHSDF